MFEEEFEEMTVRDALQEAFWNSDDTFVMLVVDQEVYGESTDYEDALSTFDDFLDHPVFTFEEVEDEEGNEGYEINILRNFE